MEKIKLIIILAVFILPLSVQGQTIKVSGNPIFPSNSFDLTEAGMDYVSTVTSSSGPTIDISHKNGWYKVWGNFNWQVAVSKSDIFWNQALEIQVRRGDGQGGSFFNNFISGGTNFQTVTNIPVNFFNGGAVRENVPIEFRINNISVLIPADNYETTIYFTIYAN